MRLTRTIIAILAFVIGTAAAGAQTFDQGPVFSFLEENDLVIKTDRHYTQGIKLSFLQADGHVPGCISRLSAWIPDLGYEKKTDKFGCEIGQNIYTPADLSTTNLITTDRPYAGWLYTGLILQRRGMAGTHPMLESFQLDAGIIGPDSLSDKAQTWVHQIRGFALPQGWNNQLKDEPGLALKYQRSYMFSRAFKDTDIRWFDFIPHGGLSLGNVDTSFRLGAEARIGLNLPDNFGVQIIDSLMTNEGGISPGKSVNYGVYVYAAVEGRAVIYNEFLDGDMFHRSAHVEKDNFITDFKGGFVVVLKHVEIGYATIYRTREFALQNQRDGFGSVFFKYNFSL